MASLTFKVVFYVQSAGAEHRLCRGPDGQLEVSWRSLMACGKPFGPGRPWVVADVGSLTRDWVLAQAYNDLWQKLPEVDRG